MDLFRLSPLDFRGLWAPLLAAISLWTGCLSIDALPVASEGFFPEDAGQKDSGQEDAGREDASPSANCAEDPQTDPLLGAWQDGDCVLEFFSNGRYDDCNHFPTSGFAADWSLLDDGRYYFGRSSLGSPSGECLARATFNEDCSTVSLSMTCDLSSATLNMTRQLELH